MRWRSALYPDRWQLITFTLLVFISTVILFLVTDIYSMALQTSSYEAKKQNPFTVVNCGGPSCAWVSLDPLTAAFLPLAYLTAVISGRPTLMLIGFFPNLLYLYLLEALLRTAASNFRSMRRHVDIIHCQNVG